MLRCTRIARIETRCVPHAEKLADDRFSEWVRMNEPSCTAAGMFDLRCAGHLQAAHIVGRRNHTVRFNKLNVHTLCQAHHFHVDQHQSLDAKYAWAVSVIGVEGWAALMTRALDHRDRVASVEDALIWLSA